LFFGSSTSVLGSCSDTDPSDKDFSIQESSEQDANESNGRVDPDAYPESVINTSFQSANSGEVGILNLLLPPFHDQLDDIPCDDDC
jgi:hypothetical protein